MLAGRDNVKCVSLSSSIQIVTSNATLIQRSGYVGGSSASKLNRNFLHDLSVHRERKQVTDVFAFAVLDVNYSSDCLVGPSFNWVYEQI